MYYVVVGAPVLAALGVALAEISAPAAFIRWRSKVTSGGGPLRSSVRDAFDKFTFVDGGVPWQNPANLRRVRLIGIVLLIITMTMGYVFLVLVPQSP
jgi:hypothetical protein